jgi:hypothetical protein
MFLAILSQEAGILLATERLQRPWDGAIVNAVPGVEIQCSVIGR